MNILTNIQLDHEFSNRLRQQRPDETAEMKASIDQHGYLTPLIVWKEEMLLVDGHHRYWDFNERWERYETEHEAWAKSKPSRLSTMFGASTTVAPEPQPPKQPEVVLMSFADRDAVLLFIAKLQYGKRNLTEPEMEMLRAEFMQRMSVLHGTNRAVELSQEAHGISRSTALRDKQYAESIEVLADKMSDSGIDLVQQQIDPDTAADKSDIIKAAELLETDPEAALQMASTPRNAKKRGKSVASPKWERLLAKHKKEMLELLSQIGDDRKLVQQVRRGYRANYEELFPAKSESKDAA